jgi:hypothetical protein
MRQIFSKRKAHRPGSVVWIVDSDQWLRVLLGSELRECGYEPYGFASIEDALRSFSVPLAPMPKVMILQLRGQNLTPQTLQPLSDSGIHTIVMGGAELTAPPVKSRRWHAILKEPVSLPDILQTLDRVLRTERAA